jgi:hypothetical protein
MIHARSLLVSVAFLLPAFAIQAAEVETDLGVDLALGYDSNPLAVSGERAGGAFADLDLDAGLTVRLHDRADLFARADAALRAHGGDLTDADERRLEARTGIVLTPHHGASSKFTLALGGTYALRRSTFTDPVTGEIYTVPTASDPAPIPDRFDRDDTGAFLELRWKVNHRVRLAVETVLLNSDYLADYAPDTELHSLDHRTRSVRPSILFRLADSAWVEVSGAWTDRDYEHQPARDLTGEEVPGTRRDFRYTGYSTALRFAPSHRWRMGLGMVTSSRDDAYAGYYDSGGMTSYAWASRQIRDRDRVQLFGSWREMEYDHAVIASDPDGDLRGSDALRFIGRYERETARRLILYLEAGTERTDDRDPVYTYDRDWVSSGFRYRSGRGG